MSITPSSYLTRITEARERHLKELDLTKEYVSLAQIPIEVFELPELEVLDLSNNELASIPEAIYKLEKLTILLLGGNQFTEIPESISNLQHLKELNLANNKITSIPTWISRLTNLTCLNLGGNQLVSIPDSISELPNLTFLNLGNNQLSSIPDSISQLHNLTVLHLYENKLTLFPKAIYDLHSLQYLNLSNSTGNGNLIKEIAADIINLKNLKHLSIEGNPLIDPPMEVVSNGIEAIKQYFHQIEKEGIDHLFEAKLLIVGEAGAGKTTLAKKIENQDYILNENEETTKGIDVIRWDFPLESGQTFRVNIWDFGGQEIYHATHQFFLTKRSLYALVVDTRKEDTDFNYWLNLIELLSDKSPLLIIKNEKQDRHREINERQLRGQFTNLKETLPTNLATNRGLEKLLKGVKHYISNLPHIGNALPRTWVRVREILENDTRNYISLSEYLEICDQNGFTRLGDKLQLSGYLHDLGVCLHFQGDPLLNKTVILKPDWGTDAVYKVLDNHQVILNLGKFNRQDLSDIWHEDKFANMHDELLQLMLNFQLCYKIPETIDTYIAPQLLTENQPEYEWNQNNNLIIRYTYDFLPKAIITRFIVVMHNLILDHRYVWRSGVLLEKDMTKAEVIQYFDKREIKIRVEGKFKKELMTIVTYELDRIHKSYSRLKYNRLIPCNCEKCKNSQEPHFYQLNILRQFIVDNQYLIQCQKSYKMVNVPELQDDIVVKHGELNLGEYDYEISCNVLKYNIEVEKAIFISYAWGGASEAIVDQLEHSFKEKGIPIVRDKQDLAFKGSIKAFMEQIGKGKCVIVVISDKYLKSENCMFELIHIALNKQFAHRVFPIVLDDAKIYNSSDRIQYVKYWEARIKELDEAMKSVSSSNLNGFREDIDLYTEIRKNLPQLTNILKDMNALTAKTHIETDFAELLKSIEYIIAK